MRCYVPEAWSFQGCHSKSDILSMPVQTVREMDSNSMETTETVEKGTVVLPGQRLPLLSSGVGSNQVIILGPGLIRGLDGHVNCLRGGILQHQENTWWISSRSKRYVPAKGDCVVGIVTRAGNVDDVFKVDIGSVDTAQLSFLAFEGATKKNRPNVKSGDVVYAKVLSASRDVEPELVCVDAYGKKAGLGLLDENNGCSTVVCVPLHICRKLLEQKSAILSQLGRKHVFEAAVGVNGRVWIRTRSPRDTMELARSIGNLSN